MYPLYSDTILYAVNGYTITGASQIYTRASPFSNKIYAKRFIRQNIFHYCSRCCLTWHIQLFLVNVECIIFVPRCVAYAQLRRSYDLRISNVV